MTYTEFMYFCIYMLKCLLKCFFPEHLSYCGLTTQMNIFHKYLTALFCHKFLYYMEMILTLYIALFCDRTCMMSYLSQPVDNMFKDVARFLLPSLYKSLLPPSVSIVGYFLK